MNIIIRTAHPNDWQEIQYLNNDVFQNDKENDPDLDLKWPYSEIGIRYYKNLAEGKYGHCFIAEDDGQAAGYIALAIKIFDYRKSKYVEVENIGVRLEYRSKGVGSLLMNEAVKWATTQNATKLIVEAFWNNHKAVNFYENNGFYKTGVELTKDL